MKRNRSSDEYRELAASALPALVVLIIAIASRYLG
jgi:hypothetical protein